MSRTVPWQAAYKTFNVRRRLNDVVINVDHTGSWQITGPPGYSGQLPVVGSSVAIAEPYGSAYQLSNIPFATQVTLDSTAGGGADIAAFWGEYRFKNVEFRAYLLAGDSYNSGNGSALPELTTYYEPFDARSPATVSSVIVRADAKRQVLSALQPLVHNFVPKPTFQLWDTSISTAYPYPNRNDLWLNTSDAVTQHFGLKGILRNFCMIGGSGCNVRIEMIADIELRRPGKA
jgi:hypothetical protein